MEYRKLGSSDLDVSVIAFGAWQIGDPHYWGPDAEADGQATVDVAIDAGVNLFDTAESYADGDSEGILGKTLGAKRGTVLIASKVSPDNCAPGQLRASCEASLQRLGTDWIDLYQVHWPFRHVPFEDAYGELTRLRDDGKIRAIGVSNFGPRDFGDWTARGSCVSNQLGYNLLFRAIEFEIVPACIEQHVGILVYMPLFQGLLSGRWQTVDDIPQNRRRTRHFASSRTGTRHGEAGCEALFTETLRDFIALADELDQPPATVALAWTLAKPGVTSLVLGARKPRQLTRNLAAVDLAPDDHTMARLDALTDPLKQQLGPNADLWLSDAESRIR